MRKLFAALALVGVACGGGEGGEAASTPAAEPAAAAPAPAATPMGGEATGTVHDVQMLLTADGRYVYQPAELTIHSGDTVRWTNVSGGPHNVAFYADQIPANAAAVLNAAMADKMTDLTGELLITANQTYEIVFAGAPAGTYAYFCTPHEMLGMKATLTVTN